MNTGMFWGNLNLPVSAQTALGVSCSISEYSQWGSNMLVVGIDSDNDGLHVFKTL